ncbi:glycoside hydrolase family 78 protein [Chitinophaga japonensis]
MLPAAALHAQIHAWSAQATWIRPGYIEDSVLRPCPIFRKIYHAPRNIRSAMLYITALGLYEAEVNGQRAGDAYFTPGWTSYDKRLQYQAYDVTKLLQAGDNELRVTIGEGWYRGAFGGLMQRDNYGKEAALLLELDVTYTDGSSAAIVSDTGWQCGTGPILHSDIYGGEILDARVATGNWRGVIPAQAPAAALVPTLSEPVTKQESFRPVKIFTTPAGEQVIDFGQNLAGWVRIRVKGKPGDTIRLSHAEVLDKAGNFYTGNLRQARATDTYILRGNGPEIFEPHFSWHGFRYVKVEGCDAKAADWRAIALYSALERTGAFSCSDPLINQLQHNIEWSLNSNFLDIPTDCPQRSERLGWTGDAHIFYRTASFNRNVQRFFAKWLQDLQADQRANGAVPNIIPNLYRNLPGAGKNGVAGWGDAAVIIPWTQYWVYNDTAILRAQYASMKAWVDHIQSMSKNDLWTVNGYGDWLAPGDSTSLPFIDQCYWAWSTQLLVRTATVLDRQEDVQYYSAMLQRVKAAFLQHYMAPGGKTMPNTQTSYVLALQFDLLPDSLQGKAAARLAALIRANDNHLSTGFLGTPYLLHVLSRHGYTDVAYTLLHQDTYPSWLYPVKMGATTIWEKWDAIRPDSSVQATSYNHYAYGAIGDWLYRVVAGIDAASPGYQRIIIRPQPGGRLTWAKARYRCPYGDIVSEWRIQRGRLHMRVEIPPGARAMVYVPGQTGKEAGPGKHVFAAPLPATVFLR